MRRALAFLALVSGVLASAAQARSGWSVRRWQSDDGLPNNRITSIAQTSDGYLWVATPTRLARFDGNRFEAIARETFAPGTSQRTSKLLPSRNGGLWLAMDHGPVIYAKSGATRFFTNNLPDENVLALTESHDGALWITYRGGEVCRLQDGKITRFTQRNGLPGWTLCSLAEDGRHRMWFAQGGEFGLFQDGRFQSRFALAKQTTVMRLAAARDGGIWICAGTELFKFDGKQPKKIGAFHPDMAGAQPAALLEDRSGGLWIGTSDSGLFYFDGAKFETVPTSHREILCLLEDRAGNLWAGTGGGLDEIQPRVVALENVANGLPFESVRSICEDAKGRLWAVTKNGLLVCRQDGVWSTISTNANWPGGQATCVTADASGAIWAGTEDFALNCLRAGKFTSYGEADGLASHKIHALLAARNGDLWIGGNAPESLQRLRDGKFKNFKLPHQTGFIRAMAEDANGSVWFGTTKGLLLRAVGDKIVNAGAQLGSTNSIRSLWATPDGCVWIGYAGWGLGRIKNGRLAIIGSARGLGDDYISQIVSDDDGWLWFGTDHGLFKVRERELNEAMNHPGVRVQSIRYGRGEGLPGLQANFDESPDAWHCRDGRLLLPMSSGLAVVTPWKWRGDSNPPPVLLNRVLVDDTPVAAYGGALPVATDMNLRHPPATMRLTPGHHRVEFDFTALCFTAPDNVFFQYRLHGYDDHWLNAGAQRSAIYSRLAAGNYQFEVRAQNSDGVWDRSHAALAFSVAPFFWETWWFRCAAIVLFSLLMIASVRYVSFRRLQSKVRALEQQAALDRERARIARDLHDQLGGTLTQMTLQLEMALRNGAKPEKTNRHVQQGLVVARQAIQSLDETVWAVSPGNDTLPHLLNYVGEYAVEFLDNAGIRCRVEMPEQLPTQPVSAETRHHLFLAVKEALNNVVRHANASEVRLRAGVDNGSLKLIVEDNGRGLPVTPERSEGGQMNGNFCAEGLRSMRQRMTEIGGDFQIESQSKGTRLSFTCPWQAGH